MPSAAEVAKLFGFIAKETPKSAHVFNAGLGMGAKGVYNLVTGRDLTDGMLGAGIMGAGIGVGLRTYGKIGVAGKLAKAEAGYVGAMEKLKTARVAKNATEAKAAAVSAGRFRSDLNVVRKDLGLAQRGHVRANQAAQSGGVVGASAATANRGTTMAANRPVNMSDFYGSPSRPAAMDDFYPGVKSGRRGKRGPIVTPPPAQRPPMPLRSYDMSIGAGFMRERGLQSHASHYQRAASEQGREFGRQAAAARPVTMADYRKASLNWAS